MLRSCSKLFQFRLLGFPSVSILIVRVGVFPEREEIPIVHLGFGCVALQGLARQRADRFNELISVRPEVRYEYALSARPWDNGTDKGS